MMVPRAPEPLAQVPFCGGDACVEDVVEEVEELGLVGVCEPFEEFCRDGVWACGFAILDLLEDEVQFLYCDGLEVNRVGASDGCGGACVCLWGGAPVLVFKIFSKGF